MARLGAMLLSLTRSEMRVYLYLVKSAPSYVSRQKVYEIATDSIVPMRKTNSGGYPTTVIRRIKNKLGDYHGIKTKHCYGYYYER